MRILIGLVFCVVSLLLLTQLPLTDAGAAVILIPSPDATPAPPRSLALPATPEPSQLAWLRPADSLDGQNCAASDDAMVAIAQAPVLQAQDPQPAGPADGPAGSQYTKWVVWEALNVYGQLFVDPESILTTQQCSYAYPCGGLPPNCTVVRKAKVLGPYCTEAEAWAHVCSRISDRGRFAISSPCPWWIVVDGVRHNSSWNPWTECPKIGGEVVIPTPPTNCPTDPSTSTPTPTATVTSTPTEIPDLTVKRIEVVQATQDENNTIPLVQDKFTIARVFVEIGNVGYDQVPGVSAELTGYRGGAVLPDSPLQPLNRTITATDPISRSNLVGALNFFLPASWLNGSVSLEARVDPADTIPETDEGNNELTTTMTFNERCLVQLGYVPIIYDAGQPGAPQAPDPAAMAAMPVVFRKVYPIGSTGYARYFQVLPAITWTEPLTTFAAEDELVVHLRELLALAQWPTSLRVPLSQLIGLLPANPTFPSLGVSDPWWGPNPGGTDQVFLANLSEGPDWTLAHEIGHNFGLHHPNVPDSWAQGDLDSRWPLYFASSTIQEVGVDTFDLQIKNPQVYYDLMTYRPRQMKWISPFHYSGDPVGEVGLYQALEPPCLAPTPEPEPDPPPPPPPPPPTPAPSCHWWYPLDIVAPPWSWVREDPGGWSTTARPGYLRILTGPGDLAGAANNARNLLVQPLLSGNFEVSTRLSFAPTAAGQTAGLLLYQDDDNYVFLGRAYDQGNKVSFVWEHAGAREVHALDFGGLSTYLRIIRNGTSFTGYYGVTADTPFRVFEYQTGMTNFRMGLAAWGGSAAAPPADFDFYCVDPWSGAAANPAAVETVAPPDVAPPDVATPDVAAPLAAAAASPDAALDAAAVRDYLMISGLLLNDGSGRLNPITRVGLPRAPRLPAAGSTFCVALLDASGAELAAYYFNDSFMDYETYKPRSSRPLLMFVPDRPGVAEVILRREELILARRTRSSNAPQVTVLEPAGGEVWTGQSRIRWAASDADGDPLRFTVLFSADGKGSWRALDVDIEGNELVVDPGALPGTSQGYIRVLATDGLNTGQADSRAPIRVSDKPPQVTIADPADGAVWMLGRVLTLSGSAYDPEDGFLDGASLTWRSDRAGVLGTGATVSTATLESGKHIITLTGRDARGQEGSASITLHITGRIYLPLVLLRAGLDQPTPTPTTQPTGPCTPLFREDFGAGGLTGWLPTSGSWTNPGGFMQGASGPVADAWNIKSVAAFNFIYEGTVTVRQGNIAGLTFRSTDGTQGYDLFVDVNGGQLVLDRRPYKVLASYTADIQRDRPYRLRVEARGAAIDAYLDGVKRISVVDAIYGTGNFGTFAYNSIATYDDLTACALSVPYELRIDAGSTSNATDTAGRTWLADQNYVAGGWGFTGGTQATTTDPIANTEEQTLYRTVHWWYGAWSLKADLPNGAYRVKLGFTETYFTAANKRVFDVKIEGQTVIAGLDLFAAVGHDTAYQRTFDVTVNDGQLNIEFVSVRDTALVAAIEVLGASSATATPTPTATRTGGVTPSPTVTSTRTRTPTATSTGGVPLTATYTATATPTATRTGGATSTATATASRTLTPTASRTATATATATATPTITRTPTATATAAGTGLYGQVTHGGAAAAGVALSLHRYDGTSDDETATTVTGADGRYAFTGMPSLPAGAAYYVLYGPNSTDPSRVYVWYGSDVTGYTAGASVAAGDFDIANVALLSPAPGVTVTLPAAFTWQRRGLSSDTYQVLITDPDTDDWWQTPDLGDVGSYTMSDLGQGMAYGTVYYWLIRVFRGTYSYGYSYYMRNVTFQAASEATGPAPTELMPMSGFGIRLPGEGGDHRIE